MRDARRRAIELFRQSFGADPDVVVRAPGRVNVIGEHTDYNEGFVLPVAIDRATWMAARRTATGTVTVFSESREEPISFDHAQPARGGPAWGEYVKGVLWALAQAGVTVDGLDGALAGDVPVGAGLSSSASLELAVARTAVWAARKPWRPVEAARACRRAENEWVGVPSGIMDQLTAAAGRAGHALLIDCRSIDIDPVPLPRTMSLVVMDTSTRRELLDSEYERRRADCDRAARILGLEALRDVDLQTLEDARSRLDETTYRRARHVVSENQRTQQAATAMRRGDAVVLGRLMTESHISLRDDFEVSAPALDTMVEIARRRPECVGARMTGAGFAGCALALVEAAVSQPFAEAVAAAYRIETGREPDVFVVEAAEGASVD